jgi:hypothetical protein
MIHIVEEIKLLLLLSNRLVMTSRLTTVGQTYPRKHIRDNARYVVTWNIKKFSVGYFPNLFYYTFYPKSERPIRHLPINTAAKDIAEGLVHLGFEIISVNEMSTTRRSPEGTTCITLPLFLIILPRMTKSQDLFKLPNLCHISIKVESYKSQNALAQCYNCQKFGHVWVNCKQPPRCLWCGGCHLHKDCPEKGTTASTPTCCNCQLAEREAVHPAIYRGCKQAIRGNPRKHRITQREEYFHWNLSN